MVCVTLCVVPCVVLVHSVRFVEVLCIVVPLCVLLPGVFGNYRGKVRP